MKMEKSIGKKHGRRKAWMEVMEVCMEGRHEYGSKEGREGMEGRHGIEVWKEGSNVRKGRIEKCM